jgi:hypothetical protein
LEWPLTDALERPIDIAEKARCKPGSLVLVPPRGILKIGLGTRPNDEPTRNSVQWRLSNRLRRRS